MDDIYRQELMEIYKNPANRGQMQRPSVEVMEKNPFCGDEVHLQLKIENSKIMDAKFYGPACAVSIVSSSYLTDYLIGKTIEEAEKLDKKDILDMIGINLTTSRVKCALLSLDSLKSAIKSYEKNNQN